LSVIDATKNTVTADYNGSGRYILASDDMVPYISALEITPVVTNIPRDIITVTVNATDSDGIANVTALIRTNQSTLSAIGGETYQGTVLGPAANGTE